MKIKEIEIRNFRSVKYFKENNFSNINVVAGINGAGKTTIINAIRILLSWFIARIRNAKGNGKYLSDADISKGEKFCFLRIVLDDNTTWQIYKQRSSVRSFIEQYKSEFSSSMMPTANRIAENLGEFGDHADITLFDAYGVNRVVNETPTRIHKKHKLLPIDTLLTDMTNSVNFHDFFLWFREVEDIENSINVNSSVFVPDHRLQAVRMAIKRFMPGYGDFKVKRTSPMGFTIIKNDDVFEFNELSDGEKAYLALVMDIARKLAMAHPTLDNPLEGDGVILVDEIDLHLHPSWQRDVIDRFKETFPNCQFFLSTHSPHIVSSVNVSTGDSLYSIVDGEVRKIINSQYGLESDRVLMEVFRMYSLRTPQVQGHYDKVWKCLNNNDFSSEEFMNNYEFLRNNVDASDPMFTRISLQIAYIKKNLNK